MEQAAGVLKALMSLRPGVLMVGAGIGMIMMSATESWGALNINPVMGDKLFDAGCVVFVVGAFYSWYRTNMDSQEAKTSEIIRLHSRVEQLEYIIKVRKQERNDV